MVKDHSDSERGNPLLPHGLLFPISSKGSFICIIPDRITHTTAFVTPVVEHWLEREIDFMSTFEYLHTWVKLLNNLDGNPVGEFVCKTHGTIHKGTTFLGDQM